MKMSKQTKNPVNYPIYEEVDAIVAKARAMRARAMRDGLAKTLAPLKRVATHRSGERKAAEA